MDRRIYKTPIGDYAVDPLATWRKLVLGSEGKINTWIADRNSEDAMKAATAEQSLIELVRSVFDLLPWTDENPKGFTDQECLTILANFNGWLQGKGDRG